VLVYVACANKQRVKLLKNRLLDLSQTQLRYLI